jgi:hypothetical protein
MLVFADGRLVAVLVHLSDENEIAPQERYLETGFGPRLNLDRAASGSRRPLQRLPIWRTVLKSDASASCGQVDPVFRIERRAQLRKSLARKPADEIRAKAHDVPAHNQNPEKRCHRSRADHQR